MRCKECNRMIPRPKTNKSGYCSNCYVKTKYARNKKSSEKTSKTMHETYDDESDHKCCGKCGLCINCGDCTC